jgi:hypothetical protein
MEQADEAGTLHVIEMLNGALEKPRPPERLRSTFSKFWPDLQKAFAAIPAEAQAAPPKRAPDDMIQEILTIARGLRTGGISAAVLDGVRQAEAERSLLAELWRSSSSERSARGIRPLPRFESVDISSSLHGTAGDPADALSLAQNAARTGLREALRGELARDPEQREPVPLRPKKKGPNK